ncbi:spore protease YyaC [Bacillus sp. FJAT-49736]|uniref:spore protease YyaC n=1 Tax=Bacillus sp. FJAT-49736 TaxID=2833582 RepID=UPI001BC917CC|nr:spore protease YyaC [Bacillus sp. FJAT-49736]MBS4175202.1 spore protease YyaC [Bacillus sp. FJAT-49736]
MKIGKGIFDRKDEELKIPFDDISAKGAVSRHLLTMLPDDTNIPIIIVCIGTDRSTGDSLGPLIGTFLKEKGKSPFHIYGTLEDPIHAVNLEEKLQAIQNTYDHPFIIGIDACLGKLKSVGMIQIGDGPVKPGAGVKKELPFVGNMHITGIVNVSGFMEFFVLQNTRLHLVLNMAKTIADGIYRAGLSYKYQHSLLNLNWRENQENTIS